jgi:uncharacterized protein YutE (UPF0331/DUF86 family)
MKVNGVIQRKLALLDKHVLELQSRLRGVEEVHFSGDLGLRWMTERALQVMAEILIDIAERIVALKRAGPAATAAESLEVLQRLGVIRDAQIYVPIVRFRNLVVHQYEEVDPKIVFEIATQKLGLLRQFRDEIDAYDLQP